MDEAVKKLLTLFRDSPSLVDVFKDAVREEEEQEAEGKSPVCWEWWEVSCAPATLRKLVTQRVIRVVYGGRRPHYALVDREAVKEALRLFGEVKEEEIVEEEKIPEDLFSIIIGHDDKKEIISRSIKGDKPVHILLVGVPASAKSLILQELRRLPRNRFVLGSALTKPGIIDLMFEEEPKYLIIDELDKIEGEENLSALLSLMETGIIAEAKYRRRRVKKFDCKVYASANRIGKMPEEILSRFLILRFKEYTDEEFLKVSKFVLIRREGLGEELAEYIAKKVLTELKSKDVRDAVKIARLCMKRTKEEVDYLIGLLKSHYVK